MLTLREREVRYGPAQRALTGNGEHITLDVVDGGRRLASALTGVDRRAVRLTGELRGYFALLSCVDDPDAARMLVDGMADWQRARGMRSLFGPVAPDGGGFGMGVRSAGFSARPELLSPSDPEGLDALLLASGLTVETEWLSYDLDLCALAAGRYMEASDWAARREGIAVRALDPLRSREDCRALHRAMGIADRIGEAEFADRLARLRPWMDPALTLVAERRGAPCGMLMALRDRRADSVRIATCHIDGPERRGGALLLLMGGMTRALLRLAPSHLTAGVIDRDNAASVAVCVGAGGICARRYRQYKVLL